MNIKLLKSKKRQWNVKGIYLRNTFIGRMYTDDKIIYGIIKYVK